MYGLYFIGGVLVGSFVIMFDVVYLLIDFVSFGISLVVMYLIVKRRIKKLSFGWYRVGMFFICIYNVFVYGDVNL